MTLREMMEKRARIAAEMRSLNDQSAGDTGDLSEEQSKKFAELRSNLESVERKIERQQVLDDIDRRADGTPLNDNAESRDRSSLEARHSLGKAITESLDGKLTGAEAEYQAEMSRGREARGVMVPVANILQTRALLKSGSGGNMVQTNLAPHTDRRRPNLKIEGLGATVIQGLTGDMDLPRLATSGTAHWVNEHQDATRSNVSYSKKTASPKTVSGEYEVSRRLINQSSEAQDIILTNDLRFILSQALDSAAIKGGGDNQPTGIISDASVQTLPGAAIDSDSTADMIAALEIDDVSGTRAFLTHPVNMALARKRKDGDGLPIPISTTFHQERVEVSTQVPVVSDGAPDSFALIYGEWASLYLMYWSAVDILLNPYHADVASKGGILMHAFLDTDVVVRHPEAFRWAEVTG